MQTGSFQADHFHTFIHLLMISNHFLKAVFQSLFGAKIQISIKNRFVGNFSKNLKFAIRIR